ncbi:MAG: primosomal protein N' [Bacillota bacterium]
MAEHKLARVVVNRPLYGTDGVFTYSVPANLQEKIGPGSVVLVPFGKQTTTGFVISYCEDVLSRIKVKDIIQVLEETPPVSATLIKLAQWMSARYLCTLREALIAVCGSLSKRRKREVFFWPSGDFHDILRQLETLKVPAQARALSVVAALPGISRQALLREAGVSGKTLDTLKRKGLITEVESALPKMAEGMVAVPKEPPTLNPEQTAALQKINSAIEAKQHKVFYLYGVTGSGKTEIYLRATAAALAYGKQAIILVPEITLAHQMILQFKGRFGNRVAVVHSAMKPGERCDERERLRSGEASIVIGARSAVFAPVKDPGLIVVDEEHEPAYKQEQAPRYHARETALARAALEGAVVILGSATPALESLARCLSGRYRQLRLPGRVDGRSLPSVRIVDLREEFRSGTVSLFSKPLADRVREKLRRKEQVLLFLNRRGFAAFVLCQACGYVTRCPNCDIALTYYQPDTLLCHYCHYRTRYLPRCLRCGNPKVGRYGAGTQRVEEEARALFPEARILRMDAETTARRGSHASILEAFRAGEADILIGTQMVAKGLDISGVTLVGVINADTTLFLPDFRAAERTFQLLYQVSGRAGRGSLPGEVIIQSHCPEHYAVRFSSRHDVESFTRRELELRRRFAYPPYSSMVRVIFSGEEEERVVQQADRFGTVVRELTNDQSMVLGPAPCPFGKLKGMYRWHIIMKGKRGQTVRDLCKEALKDFAKNKIAKVRVTVDVDPQTML